MRHLLTSLLLLALAVPALRADDTKSDAKAAEEFKALKKEFDGAQGKFLSEQQALARKVMAEKNPFERKALERKLQEFLAEDPGPKFAPRFFAFAEKKPGDAASALYALHLALRYSDGPGGKDGLWDKAVAVVRKDYVKAAQVKRLLRILANSEDEASELVIRDVMEKNPDRVTRARAAKALADVTGDAVDLAKRLKVDKDFREKIELNRGRDFVQKLIDKGEKVRYEHRELTRLIEKKYADIVFDVSVEKKVPEVVSQDLDGKPVKLSDLKGKVVVLDVWATWCGPCRAMIPHEREMVARLKGKPFALVSVSADDDREAVKHFLSHTPMPWTHWWNGPEEGVVDDWNVRSFPGVFVIDAEGVLRYTDLRGEKLEEAVNDLLKEVEDKKGRN